MSAGPVRPFCLACSKRIKIKLSLDNREKPVESKLYAKRQTEVRFVRFNHSGQAVRTRPKVNVSGTRPFAVQHLILKIFKARTAPVRKQFKMP